MSTHIRRIKSELTIKTSRPVRKEVLEEIRNDISEMISDSLTIYCDWKDTIDCDMSVSTKIIEKGEIK